MNRQLILETAQHLLLEAASGANDYRNKLVKLLKDYKYKVYKTKNYIFIHFDQADHSGGLAVYLTTNEVYIIQGQDFDENLTPEQNIKDCTLTPFTGDIKLAIEGRDCRKPLSRKSKPLKLNLETLVSVVELLEEVKDKY